MKSYSRPLQALLVAALLLIVSGSGLRHAQAEQPAAPLPHFQDVPNECSNGTARVTATRYADVPGQLRFVDGTVKIKMLQSHSPLKVTSTVDGLQFNGVGKSGTPSALLPLVQMPFNKASMTVEFRPGITVFRDGTGHSAAIYAYGSSKAH